jgi:hypothetical protein
MRLWGVTKEIRPEFLRVKQWLDEALDYNGGDENIKGVWSRLLSGELLLLTSHNAAIVLEPVEHPQRKILNFFLAGGDLEELMVMEAVVADYARSEGFDALSVFGRRGWLRQLEGYKEKAVYMEKKLNEES